MPVTTASLREGAERYLPAHLRHSFLSYVLLGSHMGSCQTAIAGGDLFEALRRADQITAVSLRPIATWFSSCAPTTCFGTRDRVTAWRAQGGCAGIGICTLEEARLEMARLDNTTASN